MRRSDSIEKIAEAQAKAQAKIRNALRAAENPGFKRGNKSSTYADLAAVWDACREALSENGIAVFQSPSVARGEGGPPTVTVTTLLAHSSGQWLENELTSPSEAKPQAIGSTITYLRRYSLAAMVGVAPEDDDGEAAMGRDTPAGRPERPEPERPAPRTNAETVKARVAAANGGAQATHMPKDAEARKADIKARTMALGFKGAEGAKKIGEWIGRECDGATTITPDDWLKADAGIAQAKAAQDALGRAAGVAEHAHAGQ